MSNPETEYTKREIDMQFKEVHDRFTTQDNALAKILAQTTMHNGRMRKIERILLIVGCVSGTLLISNGSELASFILQII